jgi:hypothetical protein
MKIEKKSGHTIYHDYEYNNFKSIYAFVNSGLHWKLARMPVESSSHLTEYVLFIETLPKIPLSVPD